MAPRMAMLSVHTSPLAALGGKDTGGMNVYVRELSRVLCSRGWLVDTFTRAQDPDAPLVTCQQEGCRTIHIAAGPVRPIDRREIFPYLPEFVEGVREFAEGQGITYDFIYSHYWLSGWVGLELRRSWRVPIAHMFHTLGRMKELAAGGSGPREAANRAQIEEEIMGSVDRIVASTPLDRQQMLDLYQVDEARIAVIPCGVNLDLFRPIDQDEAREVIGVPGGRQMFLYVGRLDPVKGLEVLLEAMCELIRRLNPCHAQDLSLAIIGGDRENHLEAMMTDLECLQDIRHELGLEDLIVFIGSRSQEMLPYYYSAALACVMPSLYESFGMVALEAMACGTPVIASRVGGLTFTVRDGETGFLVPERDPQALADKLELVFTDECLRRRLGHRGVHVAAAYGWDLVADEIEYLCRELGVATPVVDRA